MKLPRSFYNITSYIGATLVLISLFTVIFLTVVGFLFVDSSSYLGLFTFIILPVFLVIGLIIIPIGMMIELKKRKKREKKFIVKGWPIIDLNISRYRNAILIFGVGSVFFLFLTGIGSYEAFHYTESVEFCGTICHEVMEPEHTAYQNSAHAKVSCVDCHVGTGADWYVQSKLSGLHQVYAVLTNNFDRPIPTPIEDLRPARETCEECHWPEKFYSRQLRTYKFFLTDSLNTEWNVGLQIKTGPEHSALGLSEGIHWHINPNVKIEYIPRRDNREEIPWVKYTNLETGKETIFQDTEDPLSEKKMAKAVSREMDCMDCHNRPSHRFFTPAEFVDHALTNGSIPNDLPFIKKIAMDLFIDPYESTDTALQNIKTYTTDYYRQNMPSVFESRQADIELAIQGITQEFNQNIFPEMGASWDTYNSHIGHKTYNGCFRCHDNKHENDEGETISKDCNICHSIVFQGNSGQEHFTSLNEELEFVHPVELKEDYHEGLCSECHRYLYQ